MFFIFAGFYAKYSGVENKDNLLHSKPYQTVTPSYKSIIFQTVRIFYEADFIGRVRVLHYSEDTLMRIGGDSTLRKTYCVLVQPIDSSGSVICVPRVRLESELYSNNEEKAKSYKCFKNYENWVLCSGPPVGDTIYLVFSERYYYYPPLFGKEVDGYIRFWSPGYFPKIFTYTRPAVAINSHLKRAKYRPYEGDEGGTPERLERFVSLHDGFQLPKDSLFTYGKKYKK